MAAGLILASRSPQRRAILERLGIAFEVVASDVEEVEQGEAEIVALGNARRKAETVAAAHAGATVLGVDTVVSLGGRLYGKPRTPDEAQGTLRALSGHEHTVTSGVCLLAGTEARTATARTSVVFRELTQELVDWYVQSGEWRERAGGYAIQGRGAALVAAIRGDYTNVVGLPVVALLELEPRLLFV